MIHSHAHGHSFLRFSLAHTDPDISPHMITSLFVGFTTGELVLATYISNSNNSVYRYGYKRATDSCMHMYEVAQNGSMSDIEVPSGNPLDERALCFSPLQRPWWTAAEFSRAAWTDFYSSALIVAAPLVLTSVKPLYENGTVSGICCSS